MRICLLCVEIFAWGKHGGFGRATRMIGRELARRGHQVFAIVPQRPGQRPVESLDGITVLGFPPWRAWAVADLARACDAEVYHSCEPSLASFFAQRAMPACAHMVTCRDPREPADWRIELRLPSRSPAQVLLNRAFESNPLVGRAVRRADAVYTAYRDAIPKVSRMYRLAVPPAFLPTPVAIPPLREKAASATVCYVGRLDPRKRPELLLQLARAFPAVRFRVMGSAQRTGTLNAPGAGPTNLEWLGFVDQFAGDRHAEVIGSSWIMLNTAAREGLPNAFLEGAAHGLAILSGCDPDGFASRFGYHAAQDDFAAGLAWLLEDGRWRALGAQARAHVAATFELSRAVDWHERAYADAVASAARRGPGGQSASSVSPARFDQRRGRQLG